MLETKRADTIPLVTECIVTALSDIRYYSRILRWNTTGVGGKNL